MHYEPSEVRLKFLEDEIRDLRFDVKQLKRELEKINNNAVFYSRGDSKSVTEHHYTGNGE